MALTYESFTFVPIAALTLIDHFVQLRGTRGPFPEPFGPVKFQLVARLTQGGSATLDPPILLRGQTNYTGVYRFANEATIGNSPVLIIPPGRYTLRITSEFYQDAEVDIDWPTDPAAMPAVLLRPGYNYPFPDLSLAGNRLTLLRGSVFQPGGSARSVIGAVVTVASQENTWPLASCATDKGGNWVIVIPLGGTTPAFDITLKVALPDGGSFDVPGVRVQPGAENTLPQTAVRGAVLSTRGTPIVNAVITLANQAGSALSGSDGRWSFYLSLVQPDTQTQLIAMAPNGQTETQEVQIRNRATVVAPAFRIAVD